MAIPMLMIKMLMIESSFILTPLSSVT